MEAKEKKILLVEDSPTQLKVLESFLSDTGYRIVSARDGIEGINKTYTELPDVIVSDILMPGLNGYEFCRLVKNDPFLYHIPVILLTKLGQQQDHFWGREAGADSYIVKEKFAQTLLRQIAALLNKRQQQLSANAISPIMGTKFTGEQATSHINYILESLLFEVTITRKVKKVYFASNSSQQLIINFFDFLRQLIDYSVAQITFFAEGIYYSNYDIREEIKLSLWEDLDRRVSEELKLGREEAIARSITLHKENIIKEEVTPRDKRVQSKIVTSWLVADDQPGILSVHSYKPNTYHKREKEALNIIAGELILFVNYFLQLEHAARFSKNLMGINQSINPTPLEKE